MNFNWKIGGEAGFGIMTSGLVFAKFATRSGYDIFDYPEYPSLIRGGHNTYEVLVSDDEVSSPKWTVDMLVCLNKQTFDYHKHRLHPQSMVLYDPDMFAPDIDCVKVPIPFTTIKREQKIDQKMVNTIAVAASIALLGGEISIYENIIHEQFDNKGPEVVDFNLKLAKIGFEAVNKTQIEPTKLLLKKAVVAEKMVATANEIFCLSATAADCRYYAAYPMTPASSVLNVMAAWQEKNQMVVRHPEDEISVINSALGASFAGVRSSVGTSGGGFALMVESLSYAGIAEIPIVVFLSMRSGPATGMPTWTEQGDLLFAVHAGHGEFPKVVLSPGDNEEMIDITLKAFDIADIYQIPVIITSDKFISESHRSLLKEKIDKKLAEHEIDRGKIVENTMQSPYLRYKNSEDGISEMLIPAQKNIYYQANSYEHIEDSHTTEEAHARIEQVDKRNRKTSTYLKNHFELPKIFGDVSKAEVVIVSWGSNKGPIIDAQKMLKDTPTAFIHFIYLYPMAEEPVKKIFESAQGKRLILVETNSHGQFGQLLRMQAGVNIKERLLKYDGRPFWPEEIRDYILGKKSPVFQVPQTQAKSANPVVQEKTAPVENTIKSTKPQKEEDKAVENKSTDEKEIIQKLAEKISG